MSSTSLDLYSASVLVTSDRCYKDQATDESGPLVVDKLTQFGFNNVDKILVQDDQREIEDWLVTLSDTPKKAIIITVGGTGLCPRDVTPDATDKVIDRRCTGIVTTILLHSMKITPFAALSRLTAGIRKTTLIVNFPGKKSACEECWECLEPLLCHSIHQINYDRICIDTFHAVQDAISVRPKTAIESFDLIGQGKFLKKEKILPTTMDENSDIIANLTKQITINRCLEENETEAQITKLNEISFDLKSFNNLNNTPRQYPSQSAPLKSAVQQQKIDRQRHSKYPLIEYYKALDILSEKSSDLYSESATFFVDGYDSVKKLIGETLAETVKTKRIVPPHRVSTMDGFVVNIPTDLPDDFGPKVVPFIEAEVLEDLETFIERQICPGLYDFFCYPVNTGGRIPPDRCVIVPVESTGPINNNRIPIYEFKKDAYTREAGSDISMDFCLESECVIGPVELSLLCSMGIDRVKIIKKPTISIMSTGNELVQPFAASSSHDDCVIDTNGPLLTAFFSSRGFTIENCGIVTDDCDKLLRAMSEALRNTDILIVSGGASMGTKDFVKEVIEVDLGGTIHFGRVNMKPGKPVAFATCNFEGRKKSIFCLPGNPVSTYITSLVLVVPYLRHSIKNNPLNTDPMKIFDIITAELVDIVDGVKDYYLDDRMEFIRAVLVCYDSTTSRYLVSVSIKQQSSRLLSLKGCDCLLVIPPNVKGFELKIGHIYPAIKL